MPLGPTAMARMTLFGHPAAGFHVMRAPVAVLKTAILFCVFPFTVLKLPPTYRREPSGDAARAKTSASTVGAKPVGWPVVASIPARLDAGAVAVVAVSSSSVNVPPRET